MYRPDPEHSCPQFNKKGYFIHCDDPSHSQEASRCNKPGRPMKADIKRTLFPHLSREGPLGHCNVCRLRRTRNSARVTTQIDHKRAVNWTIQAKEYFHALRESSDGDFGAHRVVRTDDLVIILLSPSTAPYLELQERQKKRREKALLDMIGELQMSITEAAAFLVSKAAKQNLSFMPGSNLSRVLVKIGATVPLTPHQAASLLLSRQFTETDIRFIRRYIGGIPRVRHISAAKWDFLKYMPKIYLLVRETMRWICPGDGRKLLTAQTGREVICARVSIIDAVEKQLNGMLAASRWPYPPKLPIITQSQYNSTVVLLISIDSGTGTLKLMAKFVREYSTQSTSEIMLLAEAHGVKECFQDLESVFLPFQIELFRLKSIGVVVNGNNIKVLTFFVGDFKILYALLGSYGPNSRYPCPWCFTPKRLIDRSLSELHSAVCSPEYNYNISDLQGRSEMKNLQGKSAIERKQKANTYNLFHLQVGDGTMSRPTNFVPPTLHIRLGVVNKILSVLDGIVKVWNENNGWQESEEESVSPATHLLASSLASIGVRREKYFAGSLSGVPCTKLMQNIDLFCLSFFHSPAGSWGTLVSSLPSTGILESDLKALSRIYVGSEKDGVPGLGFYLNTQKMWSPAMLSQWPNISENFITRLKKAFWRPAGRISGTTGNNETAKWRQPMMMPKLHCLAAHVITFTKAFRYWGAFTEESFERFQQIRKKTRARHAHNKPMGSQIYEDIQYSWLMCLPQVLHSQEQAEKKESHWDFLYELRTLA